MNKFVLVVSLALLSAPVLAHPGNTDKYGCHTDKRIGYYHCHTEKPQKNKALEIFDLTAPKKEATFDRKSLFVKPKESK